MDAGARVRLSELMARTEGVPDVVIGLIDGPVAVDHPDLVSGNIVPVGNRDANCECRTGIPCLHGTFVAGILCARRESVAPAICPGCTLLVCPVYADCATTVGATPDAVADAIHDCIDAGAQLVNISSALTESRLAPQAALTGALQRAMRHGVVVVVAAGNAPTVGATALTAHPWVIPVTGYDRAGRPMRLSTVGRSIGSRGLGAPGADITSLVPDGRALTLNGTSLAAPFVTGTAALLWSLFRHAPAGHVRQALAGASRRTSIIPPLLDAESAYQILNGSRNVA